ncbi:hypothetical protein VTN02DRAFT_5625 [Thermoascus thermophilus]
MPEPLQTHIHTASATGLNSITTLIEGPRSCILIDPPLLIPDAVSVIAWIRRTTAHPLKAIFITHHHPDHYFSAEPILAAFPGARFYAAPYVLAGIEREYADKTAYWPRVFGRENIPATPAKPEAFGFSFFLLEGAETSPVLLLGPVQGDSVDHTLFWLPRERTVVCGDAVYGRSTHVWVEEVETPALLTAWHRTLDLIDSLRPTKIIPGHLEAGWALDAAADLAHTRRYLDLFGAKVTYARETPQMADLYRAFEEGFPQARTNVEFFLGKLSNRFGAGGEVWAENRHHDVGRRTEEGLLGYRIG